MSITSITTLSKKGAIRTMRGGHEVWLNKTKKRCAAGLGMDNKWMEQVDMNTTSQEVGSFPHRRSDISSVLRKNSSTPSQEKIYRLLMVLALVLAASGSSGVTYLVSRRTEEAEFKAKIENYSKEIVAVSALAAHTVIEAVAAMSDTTSSYVTDQNASWPFVKVPHFKERAESILELSGADLFMIVPIVSHEQRMEWEEYSVANQDWTGRPGFQIKPFVFGPDNIIFPKPDVVEPGEPIVPVWQISPSSFASHTNLNTYKLPISPPLFQQIVTHRTISLSPITTLLNQLRLPITDPITFLAVPIFQDINEQGPVVGAFVGALSFLNFLQNILAESCGSMVVVVKDTCGNAVTYAIDGPKARFVGEGDLHPPISKQYEHSAPFNIHEDNVGLCRHSFHIFPSLETLDSKQSGKPKLYACAVAFGFFLSSLSFALYDAMIRRRERKMMVAVSKTSIIIDSLFPKQFQDRIINQQASNYTRGGGQSKIGSLLLATKPIAELFPRVTVVFADLVGFTSWSSSRHPIEVFTLLEIVFASFDVISKRLRTFKIETIGDCYVGACGLPQERDDHAVCMARFAARCLDKLTEIVGQLEVLLGPDTSDLGMRFGLHSGPVTAGILRGEKSRFQLFGDTVNLASRIEASGKKNSIHMSSATADALITRGKGAWVVKRKEPIMLKGRGTQQTYWLSFPLELPQEQARRNSTGGICLLMPQNLHRKPISFDSNDTSSDLRTERTIQWIVRVLQSQLKVVVTMRRKKEVQATHRKTIASLSARFASDPTKTVIDEVKEIIDFDNEAKEIQVNPKSLDLSPASQEQLEKYVTKIAGLYRKNSFHCFEHAGHVVQSVNKLLARIVMAGGIDYNTMRYMTFKEGNSKELHDGTFGITSDPIISFACTFSALIHDCDHQGVSNETLVREGGEIAKAYRNKSVAEQNSVDLAWSILMQDDFVDLRACIYTNEAELNRFRQLIVNSVMATDIVDKELGAARKARWVKAFTNGNESETRADIEKKKINRKATIVIEHIIQASDVSHTMQHWHIYIKWNERLFHELYKAYLDGRGTFDPSKGWYEGEIDFFDYYIIPLAKKLAECGVFGVSSDEYLNYAIENRKEWILKGRDMVAGYISGYERQICNHS